MPGVQKIGMALWLLIIAVSPAFGQDYRYEDVKTGTLSGKIIVQWLEPDLFLFLPDKESPFTFTRSNGQKITPGRMQTDGGSIPRPIWVLRNYSPWGFAPAYIIHDWIFETKHCKYAGYEQWSLGASALVMAEVMKTMIVQGKIDAGPLTVGSMHAAVTSGVAQKYWDEGKCTPAKPGMFAPKPIQEYVLSF